MISSTASRLGRTAAGMAVAATLVGMTAAGAAVPANAKPNSDDPNCFVEPYLATCEGGAFGIPTSPSDPQCAMDPADAVCSGGPFGPASTPPPVGSGLPGSINADGTAAGSPPIGIPGMPGSIPGMPGSI